MAAKLVFFYSSGVLRCLPAASSSQSNFRIIISEAAELPSPAGTGRCPQKFRHWWLWGDEVVVDFLWEVCASGDWACSCCSAARPQCQCPKSVYAFSGFSCWSESSMPLLSVSQKRDAEVTIVVGWLSWKFTVFKLQLQVHTRISEVGSASKGGGN